MDFGSILSQLKNIPAGPQNMANNLMRTITTPVDNSFLVSHLGQHDPSGGVTNEIGSPLLGSVGMYARPGMGYAGGQINNIASGLGTYDSQSGFSGQGQMNGRGYINGMYNPQNQMFGLNGQLDGLGGGTVGYDPKDGLMGSLSGGLQGLFNSVSHTLTPSDVKAAEIVDEMPHSLINQPGAQYTGPKDALGVPQYPPPTPQSNDLIMKNAQPILNLANMLGISRIGSLGYEGARGMDKLLHTMKHQSISPWDPNLSKNAPNPLLTGPQDKERIDKPGMYGAKTAATIGAYLLPPIKALQSAGPLSGLGNAAISGGLHGGAFGFGQSNPGNEIKDTAIGGAGGAALGTALEALIHGIPGGGGSGKPLDAFNAQADEAYKSFVDDSYNPNPAITQAEQQYEQNWVSEVKPQLDQAIASGDLNTIRDLAPNIPDKFKINYSEPISNLVNQSTMNQAGNVSEGVERPVPSLFDQLKGAISGNQGGGINFGANIGDNTIPDELARPAKFASSRSLPDFQDFMNRNHTGIGVNADPAAPEVQALKDQIIKQYGSAENFWQAANGLSGQGGGINFGADIQNPFSSEGAGLRSPGEVVADRGKMQINITDPAAPGQSNYNGPLFPDQPRVGGEVFSDPAKYVDIPSSHNSLPDIIQRLKDQLSSQAGGINYGADVSSPSFSNLVPDTRGNSQIQIEELLNKGDAQGAQNLINNMPDGPYKQGMQGLMKMIGGTQVTPFTQVKPGVMLPANTGGAPVSQYLEGMTRPVPNVIQQLQDIMRMAR